MNSSHSSSESSSESSSPRSLSSFDPFAVHSFTNCAAVPSNAPPANSYRGYPYPYAQSNSKAAPNSTLPSNVVYPKNLPIPNLFPSVPTKGTEIFVTFRQETPSPELEEILKPKTGSSSPLSSPNSSKPRSASPAKRSVPRK